MHSRVFRGSEDADGLLGQEQPGDRGRTECHVRRSNQILLDLDLRSYATSHTLVLHV